MEPTPLQVSSYTHLLYKAQDPFSACRQSQVQNNFLYEIIFLTANSLCFTDQETQEEIYWVEQTPLQVSSYTHLLYKAQDPLSACRQSQVHNNFLYEIIFKRDQSLLHRSRNSGRDILGGANSFAGQLICRKYV